MSSIIYNYGQLTEDYQRIEQALTYLAAHYQEQPALEDVAASVGLSEYHFQRVFTRWVGISPKRFLQFLTKEHARALLDHSASVLDAAYQSGLSGPGRLHDLFVNCEAVTPGEYKLHGDGLEIAYGFHPSPFGECMVALTERGICGLAFVSQGDRRDPLDDLRRRWTKARLVEDVQRTAPLVEQIFPLAWGAEIAPLHLYLNGTNFQIKVWEALLRIPPGSLVTYEEIATYLGRPSAARAVGRAVATNPISFIIPCHRVIRKIGALGGYRWGLPRKAAMLGWEMARV
jgi:AraC family transcriptional regulator, regulatory protein of adaptative response / methylated-DNA-[protein]-cysteine methyltransferase